VLSGSHMKKNLQNGPDIVGLITRIQEQLTLLEKKVDILISQSLPKPADVKPFPKPFQQPVNTHAQAGARQDNRYRERVMHKAICADCKKECEVPFRPSGGRPVYCQECFSRRKSGNSFKANIDNRPKEAAPTQVTHIDKSQAIEKKKSAGKKKFVEKKKPVSKKRKSGK
jgi:CxxC-x17-CxxC domain-containing protein